MPKYLKPKISSKKIKLNFFLTNIIPLDRFTIIGDVYAGSGDCSCGGNCGCDLPACESASNSGRIEDPRFGGFGGRGFDFSCTSNSLQGGGQTQNCQGGCLCNSQGGRCNSGSGGGSGNSGSGSCNSGG